MPTTKQIGNIGEAVATAELIKRGIPVSLPVGDNERYDLIFEHKGKLWKAQVKTCAKCYDNKCTFLCVSKKNHTTNKKLSSYVGKIDYFIFYCIELDLLAMVPIETVGTQTNFNLRVAKPKNNNKNVHYFTDYTIDAILGIPFVDGERK